MNLSKDTLERNESYNQDLLIIILKVDISDFRNMKIYGLMIEMDKIYDIIESLYDLMDYKKGVSSENINDLGKIQKIALSCRYDEVFDDFGYHGRT